MKKSFKGALKKLVKSKRENFSFSPGKMFHKHGNEATKAYYVNEGGETKNFSYDLGGCTDKQYQFNRNQFYN
jgi:hypothetical protein